LSEAALEVKQKDLLCDRKGETRQRYSLTQEAPL